MKFLLVIVLFLGFVSCGKKPVVAEVANTVQEMEAQVQEMKAEVQKLEAEVQANPQSEEAKRKLDVAKKKLAKGQKALAEAKEDLVKAQKEDTEDISNVYKISAFGGVFSVKAGNREAGSVILFSSRLNSVEIRYNSCIAVKASDFSKIQSMAISTSQGYFTVCENDDCVPSHYSFNGNGSGKVSGRTFIEQYGEGWIEATSFGRQKGQFRRSIEIPGIHEIQAIRESYAGSSFGSDLSNCRQLPF